MPDDITATMARDVAPILAPGEELSVAAIITSADPGATGPVRVGPELGNFVLRLLTLGLVGENTQLMRRAFWGRAVSGPPDSLAHTLHDLIHEASWAKLVLTDRRVIIARGELLGPGSYKFDLVGSLPRTAVVGARPAPKGLMRRGRLELRYADGSTGVVNLLKKQSSVVLRALGG
ncbi:MAG: hypothetical protein HOV71_27355 [Hamadaea sp.]|uniref:hypothetical protein n=1 Tax=Hamadaea sp. NPDC050747 TaxID=3155789 RepID=UPI0017AA3621|nr:hypothetical protein [Hamadaea sp.]NUR51860.1 hypothetical protein [Hamadaea sp.]NUR70887.1 hypothetical protein [Hamadaea sp.]NUT02261.1 hypothetical protein [Hamadaea sp.]